MDPDGSILSMWETWVLLFLIMCSAFFSASETALFSFNKLRLRTLVDADNQRAKLVSNLMENSNKLIATILIGNNVVNILASTIATAVFISLWGAAGAGISAVVMTLVILIFGEILPKSTAIRFSEAISLRVGRIIHLLTRILSPLVWFFDGLSNLVINLVGGESEEARVTEEEIRTLIALGQEEGVLDEHEHQLISSVFQFGETTAEEVMVPRIDMCAVPVDISMDELADTFAEKQYSRLPVYEGSIEHIVGSVHLKDFIRADLTKGTKVTDLMRPVLFVPETVAIETVFARMKRQRISTAIVLDEYGQTVGMLTPSDIIEEVMGQFLDEHDDAEEDVMTLGEGTVVVDGGYLIEDLNEEFGFCIPDEVANTIGGYIFHRLGRVPRVNDRIALTDNLEAVVVEMARRRIAKVRLVRTVAEPLAQEA